MLSPVGMGPCKPRGTVLVQQRVCAPRNPVAQMAQATYQVVEKDSNPVHKFRLHMPDRMTRDRLEESKGKTKTALLCLMST